MKTIKNWYEKLIVKLFHVQDIPDSTYGREWKYGLHFSKKYLSVSWELNLIRWEGKLQEPRPVCMAGIMVKPKIKEWKVESDHTYYDGHHCSWQLGPILVYRSGFGHCDKCYNEA